jgi:hypothetical protein
MRQRATWLVVVALAALGTVAAVDALRGGEAPPEQPKGAASRTTTRRLERPGSVVVLAPASGLEGVLYYSDQDCRVHALQLPGLEEYDAPQLDECAFSLSPSGRAIQPSSSVWSPDGASYAAAVANHVEIGSGRRVFAGRVPAWRPDGVLTYVRGGAVRAWPSERVLLSAGDLRRAAARHPNVSVDRDLIEAVQVKHMGWLSSTRVVLLLGVTIRFVGDFDLAAVFEQRRLVGDVAAFQSYNRLTTSPVGSFFALLGGNQTLELYDRNGDARPLPQLTDPRAVAWSPDDSWAAVATRASVYLFRTGEAEPRVRRLPIVAHDLAWLTGGGPELGDTAPLGRWLGRAGIRGNLYLSDAGCRIRRLRLPEMDWGDPDGVRGPCRFSVAPNGAISHEGVVWQTHGRLGATCQVSGINVVALDGSNVIHRDRACAPAWKPNGVLTYVDQGELLVTPRLREERVVVSRDYLAAAFGPDAGIEEVAWIDDRQFGAAVRRGSRAFYAVFYRGQLVARPSFSSKRIEGLRSNGRGIVAAQTGFGRQTITFFDLRGHPLWSIPGGRTVGWSPGGTLAAVTRGSGVLLVDPLAHRIHALPLYAADVEWR